MINQAAATTSNALAVMVFDPSIRAFLEANDPKALEQAEEALTLHAIEVADEELAKNLLAVRSECPECGRNHAKEIQQGVSEMELTLRCSLYDPTKAA